jgi:adenine/guanine phosphoribosyltransferase-like PRPP-binding protein
MLQKLSTRSRSVHETPSPAPGAIALIPRRRPAARNRSTAAGCSTYRGGLWTEVCDQHPRVLVDGHRHERCAGTAEESHEWPDVVEWVDEDAQGSPTASIPAHDNRLRGGARPRALRAPRRRPRRCLHQVLAHRRTPRRARDDNSMAAPSVAAWLPDSVLAPATAGVALGWTLARRLGLPLVLADVGANGRAVAVHDAENLRDRRVLLVNDVVTTGHGIAALAHVANEARATVAGATWFLSRGDADVSEAIGAPVSCIGDFLLSRWSSPRARCARAPSRSRAQSRSTKTSAVSMLCCRAWPLMTLPPAIALSEVRSPC